MKKLLLAVTALFVAGSAFAQTTPAMISKKQAERISVSVPMHQQAIPQNLPAFRSDIVPSSAIGQTYYDLQTNGSIPQRLVNYPDGTIGATWTTATSSATRGAGYNYFNGTSWANVLPNADRIESVRGGWPTMAALGDNGEIVVSHNGSTGLIVNLRPQKGSGDWIETTLLGPSVYDSTAGANSTALLWPAMATNGNTIHLIACTESDAGSYYQGIQTCLVYYRGTFNPADNTIAWENPRIVGDMGNHTDWFNSFSGDAYNIACNGNTVAVVVADQWSDAFLWKSTDNGVNFTTTTVVNSFVPDNFNEEIHLLDTTNGPTYVTDGATAIAIDNNGKVHLAFGLAGVNNPELGDGYITSYPYVDGLLYWNEDMPTFPGTAQNQLSPDSLINAGYTVFSRTDLDGDGSVWYMNSAKRPENYHRIGMTSQPTLAVDGNNVYLVYSSVLDIPFYDANTTGMYFMGVFGVKSTDGGASFEDGISWLSYSKYTYYVDWDIYDWSSESAEWTSEAIVNEMENIYPSLAKDIVNGKLSMIWHNDYFPDNAAGGIATNPTNVLFLSIPANQLGLYNNTVEIPQGLWIDHVGIADNTLSGMKLYPNPASDFATVAISSSESANASMTIFNLMGQMVYNENVALNEGENTITVNTSNFQAGVYMINITTNKGTSTQKLIVK